MTAGRQLQAAGDGSAVTVTDDARQLRGRIRAAVSGITGRLRGDLPPEDLVTAGRVLTVGTERGNAELAR